MEFLVRGAMEYNEPGVFMAFEETAEELTQNVRSLGFDLDELRQEKKLVLDFVRIERSEIDETGDYDLEGLFIRLGHRHRRHRREARGAGHNRNSVLPVCRMRAFCEPNCAACFAGSKTEGVTAVITAERGEGALTRHGLEEYVSDCVILLDHRVTDQVSTRRLRIVKYRGTTHGTNEYPFLIDEDGFSVLPVTSLGLQHKVSDERISSGVPRLDTMLGGEGFYRGTTILVSGTAGTGKTSLAAQLRRCRLPARRALPVLLVRGIAGSAHSQYAIDRHEPGELGQEGSAAVSFQPGYVLRTGNAPGDHSQDGRATSNRRWWCSIPSAA